jgi:2-polyprenyl-6-methoxyphenol hydroxylase-like FAD-dependent oxidoreductase
VVVLGAGLAGALAAAAAALDGRSVVVIERDVLPAAPVPRRGVPQGRQAHVFLLRGLLAVEELLPGFRTALHDAGAVALDTGDLAWLGEFGWAPTVRQFEVLSATRPLFEQVVLDRVRALPGVMIRDGTQVEGLRRVTDAGTWAVDLQGGATVTAHLVIDATGRSSRLPQWLSALGLSTPATTEVDARIGYATRVYAVPPGAVRPAGVVLQQTPATQSGGLALPVEDGRWLVGVVGAAERRPPRGEVAFEGFVAGLHDPALAELVDAGVPVGDVAVHRQTGNLRRHYDRMRDWPTGLLVLGDSLCAFNPVYGQGVTVAACEALLLRDALRRGLRPGDERRLLRRFGRVAAVPWAIATSEDLRYPSSTGDLSWGRELFGRWTRELGRLSAHGDAVAHSSLARVYHLMAGPRVLLDPRLVVAAVRARIRGYGPVVERPVIVE